MTPRVISTDTIVRHLQARVASPIFVFFVVPTFVFGRHPTTLIFTLLGVTSVCTLLG
jgi:hypothetical protein